ncbi:MAG: dehydratase [Alcaligenaceae bacterium]|nr:dehydratase [Alcaligenaceae bacterium]
MSNTLYFEDFKVNQSFLSSGRTITEADLTFFNMLSGDWNPIHCDVVFASKTRFGQRIVPGAFGISLLTGFMHQMSVFEGSAVAMLNLKDWSFRRPILVGDTLKLRMTITETDSGTSPRTARLGRRLELLNENDDIVQEGSSDLLILKKTKS